VNEEELANLLSTLEQGLLRVGLSSLVDQERIVASEGRTEELTTGEVAELHREWSRQRRGPASRAKVGDVRVRPLGTGEQLAELLDLVEVAVGGTYAIEVRLRGDLKAALDSDDDLWNGQVVFATPPESVLSGTSSQEWILPDQPTLQRRASAVREAILLINQLRELAQLPRGERLDGAAGSDDDANDIAIPGEWS
jgi:hypothetical protein